MIRRFEWVLLMLGLVSAGGTGLLYGWARYWVRNSDPFAVANHPWQPLFQHAHVLAAPLLLFALGMIARDHILGGFRDRRARRGRRVGIAASLLIVPMALSGYLAQVLTAAGARDAMGWLHLGSGLLFLLLAAAHLVIARSAAPSRAESPRAGQGSVPGPRSLPGTAGKEADDGASGREQALQEIPR